MPANSSPGRRLSASTILSLAAFVLGCGSPGNTGPSPSVRVMPGSQALALPAGGSGGTSLTISRGNFNGPVRLAVGILPTGVSASFDPEVVAESSSSVTFNAIANAIPGTYDVLVRATGGGVPDAELTLSITVAAPSFILTSEVDAVTLASGTSAAVPVKAFRLGGFNGVISYAVTGAPVGLDAAMMSTARPDSSTLVLVAQSTLANGSYRVVVTGRAPGATDQTLPVAVTVNTAPSATRATGIALRR